MVVGSWPLHYHSNRSLWRRTAVAQSVMASFGPLPSSSLPQVFFMSRPSLSASVQCKPPHTVRILLHDDEQNTGAQATEGALWLVGGRWARCCVCTPSEGSYIRRKVYLARERTWCKMCSPVQMALCLHLKKKKKKTSTLQCLFLENLNLWGTHMFSHIHIQYRHAKLISPLTNGYVYSIHIAFACTRVMCFTSWNMCWSNTGPHLARLSGLHYETISHSKPNVY